MGDSYIMFKRNLKKTMRSPEAMIMALVVPFVMMVLFGLIFGSVAEIEGFSYINFIVPGIILQCICNASGATALSVHGDMSKGIVDRFRSMRISKAAFISGHVGVSVIRNIIIVAVSFGAAILIGFRPEGGFFDWLVIAGILFLFIVAITWIVVIIGLIVKDTEGVSGVTFLLTLFTFISSGFAPVENLPTALRIFAQYQPMTAIVDAMRGLLMGSPVQSEIALAVVWCVGIIIVAFILALRIYKNKMTV